MTLAIQNCNIWLTSDTTTKPNSKNCILTRKAKLSDFFPDLNMVNNIIGQDEGHSLLIYDLQDQNYENTICLIYKLKNIKS